MDPRGLPFLLNKPELRVMYQRLGTTPEARSETLSDILSDFYKRMSQDILIGFFFDGKDVEAIAMMQKQFLLRAFGETPTYAGKSPANAHLKMPPILEGHFNRRLQLLNQTLRDHGLPESDIQVWLTFENAFKDSIVS